MIRVTLYSRPGCHLCDEMKAVIERVRAATPFEIEEIDISREADLEARYGVEIPVVEIAGRRVAKYRITEAELLRALRGRA